MSTTLGDWYKYGWLVKHQTSKQEIGDLLALADHDLQTAQLPDLPADWRLKIAYNAALESANAALAASGYRAEKAAQHYRIIQSLELTVGMSITVVNHLDAFRKKRNISNYDRPGTVSEVEANEMLTIAQEVRSAVLNWLLTNKPYLLED